VCEWYHEEYMQTNTDIHTHRLTHRHTSDTQTHRHTETHTQHTETHTQHTDTQRHTETHRDTCTYHKQKHTDTQRHTETQTRLQKNKNKFPTRTHTDQPYTVSEMATVRQVEAHKPIMRAKHRHIHGKVGR
jgi:hypothetical protein